MPGVLVTKMAAPAKARWYDINLRIPLSELVKTLNLCPYTHKRGWGFELLKARKEEISGKFIEKQSHTSELADPFGNIETVNFVTYNTVNFRFLRNEKNDYILWILNPPRSL